MSKKYKQGRFYPKNKNKYKGDIDNIIYRSSLELAYFNWCDINSSVKKWSSEEIVVPYKNVIDGKIHRYFVDLWLKIEDRHGNIKEYIAELKPYTYTTPEHLYTKSGKLTRSIRLKKQWLINQMKWKEANNFAKKKGMNFIILTEKDIR